MKKIRITVRHCINLFLLYRSPDTFLLGTCSFFFSLQKLYLSMSQIFSVSFTLFVIVPDQFFAEAKHHLIRFLFG